MWISSTAGSIGDGLALYGPPAVIAGQPLQQELLLTSTRFRTGPVFDDGTNTPQLIAELSLPEPSTPLDDITTFFRLTGGVREITS